ncbi:MAG: membrane protein insertion efficiency factor YidD [Candidatus Omnitrophota bacterium]
MTNLMTCLIRLYQKVSRSIFSPSCRFAPSCSDYAIDALHQHGPLRGSLKSLWRIARCSPFSKGGYDPVK